MQFSDDDFEAIAAAKGFPPVRHHLSLNENLQIAESMRLFNRGATDDIPDDALDLIPEELKAQYREFTFRLMLYYHTLAVKKFKANIDLQPIPRRTHLAFVAILTAIFDIVMAFNAQTPENQAISKKFIVNMATLLNQGLVTQCSSLWPQDSPAAYPTDHIIALAKFWDNYAKGQVTPAALTNHSDLLAFAVNTLSGNDSAWDEFLTENAEIFSLEMFEQSDA